MNLLRTVKWVGGALVALTVIGIAGIEAVGWSWLRGPIVHLVEQRTGRRLAIDGDLTLHLGWPGLQVRATKVSFGNPDWAKQKAMMTADEVAFSLDLPFLFRKYVVLDEVLLRGANVYLEKNAQGQKNWLLDRQQKDENASVEIGHLTIDASHVAYDEAWQKTSIQSEIVTTPSPSTGGGGITFKAKGVYKGMPLNVHGSGGSVLALRDEGRPYPFNVDATIGSTSLQAEGSITGLSQFSAVDVRIVGLRGDSLAKLYPLLGIALPETPPYQTSGHLTHHARSWNYEGFSARIGKSDLSGALQVDSGGKRPFLHGNLVSRELNLADLGSTVGVPAATTRRGPLVLPDQPYRRERWDSVDADIKLTARTIIRAKELPLENLSTRVQMRDSVLSLDPLEFGMAGGLLVGAITLDGRQEPIRAHAQVQVRKIVLSQLLPTVKINKASVGRIDGALVLSGTGNSVGRMLATANGTFGLVVAGGQISRLMMEMAGLHLLEIVTLKIAGDQVINIRCGIADFKVQDGVMQTNTLVFDTTVSNIGGSGSIDLKRERLDLTLVPQSKETNLIALRSPIYIRGNFSAPTVELDKGRIAARGIGALALGIANPLLVLLPLVENGPGMDSDCGQLIREVRASAGKANPTLPRAPP